MKYPTQDPVQRLIVRQTCLKAAVEITPDHVKWINSSGEYEESNALHLVQTIKYLTDQFERIVLSDTTLD